MGQQMPAEPPGDMHGPGGNIPEAAVIEYVENHRDEINERIKQSLQTEDGSFRAQLLRTTGFTNEDLEAVGGLDANLTDSA